MTIWILREELTPDEEEHIQERTHLPLPLGGLPDLSMIGSQLECRHLLKALNPDDPPEIITRKTERVWGIYSGLQAEDIIAVPLANRKEIALAQITKRYEYKVDAHGDDVHQVAVKWYDERLKFSAFRKHKGVLENRGEKMSEIANPKVRIIIRDRLPHSYNRFAKWKWLLAFFFIMGLISRVKHLAMMVH